MGRGGEQSSNHGRPELVVVDDPETAWNTKAAPLLSDGLPELNGIPTTTRPSSMATDVPNRASVLPFTPAVIHSTRFQA